eukprot:gene13422-15814_t
MFANNSPSLTSCKGNPLKNSFSNIYPSHSTAPTHTSHLVEQLSSPLKRATTDMNINVFNRGDLRRPSIASGMDEGPNGADIHYLADHSLGATTGAVSSRFNDEIDIVVVGGEQSCKSKFITSFINNRAMNEDPSAEVPYRRTLTIKNGTFNVNVLCNAGLEEFWGINDYANRAGHGFIFLYNVNSKESFAAFNSVREKILYDKSVDNVIMSIVGFGENEIDRETGEPRVREVSVAEVKRMADLYSCTHIEIPSFDLEFEQEITGSVADILHRVTNYTGSNTSGAASSDGSSLPSSQHTTEVLVLGDTFVGKSQYVARCTGAGFQSAYRETSEWSRAVVQRQLSDARYFIKMVDTRGFGLDESLTRERLLSSRGFIFMYSSTSKESFRLLEGLRRKVLAAKSETKVPCILIANKSDCPTLARQVPLKRGQELAQKWGCPFYEISALTTDDDEILKSITQLLVDMQKMNNNIDVGEFKREGYLLKDGSKIKSLSRYYFKIKRGHLYYCKNQAHTKNIKSMELSDQVQVQAINTDKKDVWPFTITETGHKAMHLIASTEAERDAWITSIKVNCYVNEFIGTIMEDVLVTMVNELYNVVTFFINVTRYLFTLPDAITTNLRFLDKRLSTQPSSPSFSFIMGEQ